MKASSSDGVIAPVRKDRDRFDRSQIERVQAVQLLEQAEQAVRHLPGLVRADLQSGQPRELHHDLVLRERHHAPSVLMLPPPRTESAGTFRTYPNEWRATTEKGRAEFG